MKNPSTLFITTSCLVSFAASLQLHAAIIPVSSAAASSNWENGTLTLTNTINGSGITGSLATEAQLLLATHDNQGSATTMWHSQIVEAAGMVLTWNFTAAADLRTIYYWNHNQSGNSNRGIQVAEIQYSTNNGGNYQSLGNFNLVQATGAAGLAPTALDLGSTVAGVTNVRFVVVSDFGGIVTGLSEIRFSTIAPVQPAPVLNLTASEVLVLDGSSVDLTWNTERVTNPTITPGLGPVDPSGADTVFPPADGDTTYTLGGTNNGGPVSTSVTVRSIIGGASTFKFVRFTPRKLRNDGTANSIQLGEFHLVDQGTPVSGGTYTNPGGSNPAGQEAQFAGDNIPTTKWLDFNKSSLQIEFPAPVTFDSYYFTTGGDSIERDPVRWVIEGSSDGATWTLVENFTAFDYPITIARNAQTVDIPLPGASVRPTLVIAGDSKVIAGEPLSLRWTTEGATVVTINDGSGAVPLPSTSGNFTVSPAVSTTYTFVSTNSFAKTTTRSLAVEVINPAITEINYEDFDDAGSELGLIGNAQVTADAAIPVPGPGKRLRLTPNLAGQIGTAWFRKRQQVDEGFDTTFAFQFKSPTTDGADGMAFMVQNHPDGSAAVPTAENEYGLRQSALSISLDSHQNAGDPGRATLRVFTGAGAAVATVNLATTPGITLPGTLGPDLSDNSANGAPHVVRVAYAPGNLDVYFDGILLVDNLPVDLAAIDAMDEGGTSYVGFTGRTGGSFEAHDVTSWTFAEGPPVPPLAILSSTVSRGAGQATITWASSPSRTYRITASENLQTWTTVLADNIPGTPDEDATMTTVNFNNAPGRLFIRVEEKP